MPLVKKCRHDRSEWRRCGCSWYSEHYNAAGKRVWENVGPRWREARAQNINLEAKAISARSNGRTVVLGTIIDRFMADYHPVSPGTLNALSHRLRVLKAEFGTVPLSRLDLVAIQTYLSANYAPSTAAKT